jgi:tetratricopeptide (TPR) repeat protein
MLDKWRAGKLHSEGQALSESGDKDGALAKYSEALTLDPERSETHYNVGLIYKYRRQWRESFVSNQRAVELAPDDEAANWNLAIAATALRDWAVARRVWSSLGMKVAPGEDPIEDDFGSAPVRLNPDGAAEVVWARRVCPVRARIASVPWPESGFRHGDVVLHDGAAVGYRPDAEGREKPVFNVFELFEESRFTTFVANVIAPAAADIEALVACCDEADVACEDWSTVRILCRACSEGRPHDTHDHEAKQDEWSAERRIGLATLSAPSVRRALDRWASDARRVLDLAPILR